MVDVVSTCQVHWQSSKLPRIDTSPSNIVLKSWFATTLLNFLELYIIWKSRTKTCSPDCNVLVQIAMREKSGIYAVGGREREKERESSCQSQGSWLLSIIKTSMSWLSKKAMMKNSELTCKLMGFGFVSIVQVGRVIHSLQTDLKTDDASVWQIIESDQDGFFPTLKELKSYALKIVEFEPNCLQGFGALKIVKFELNCLQGFIALKIVEFELNCLWGCCHNAKLQLEHSSSNGIRNTSCWHPHQCKEQQKHQWNQPLLAGMMRWRAHTDKLCANVFTGRSTSMHRGSSSWHIKPHCGFINSTKPSKKPRKETTNVCKIVNKSKQTQVQDWQQQGWWECRELSTHAVVNCWVCDNPGDKV